MKNTFKRLTGVATVIVCGILLIIAGVLVNYFNSVNNIVYDITTKTFTTTTEETTTITTTTTKKTTKKVVKKKQVSGQVSNSFKGFVTHYGPDCRGCSGITASGYNVRNTIYYNDKEYGQVRIVATSRKLPLYSIIRINDYKDGNFVAIVLDRGVSGNTIDILVESEKKANKLGIQKNVSVDILRKGR